jgi:hypothetical protein
MKARVRILKFENINGTSAKTGNDYNMDFMHVLDIDNFDKFKVLVPKDELVTLRSVTGKEGVLDCCFNPKTDKFDYASFKVAA